MNEYDWLLSAVAELKSFSEAEDVPDVTIGLNHVLRTFMDEANLTTEQKQEILESL